MKGYKECFGVSGQLWVLIVMVLHIYTGAKIH